MKTEINFELNGKAVSTGVSTQQRLIDLVRDQLGYTGTKEGCGEGECGACTVLVNDRAVNACLLMALEVDGARVTTVEGLLRPGQGLSPIQQAFIREGGVQCGFCTPGMVMSAVALLAENRNPSDEEIRDALVGNLCRCTGYVQIIAAVRRAAQTLQPEASP